ncbi:MAG: imidazole glycerol phosphate synthase subunit HisH [Eubacteriales bacterium]|nr:imidazole glycerol phosphate synthase subunit HisH [Eubacteriales bacterium]MDD4476331.1 imidazole glycerol phosphate synthase subunit HisH [Eubacteriales bacterium]
MISIIDYGRGNLASVKNALDFIGARSSIISTPSDLAKADGLILPGVGAYPDAISALKARGLFNEIRAAAGSVPLLGICLGMQLLFDSGEEFTETEGLGLIPGKVVKLSAQGLAIPHMGWNELTQVNKDKIGENAAGYVYFVHSYKALCNRDNIIYETVYGESIPALVRAKGIPVYGAQYHPEKSDEAGLKLLKNFVNIVKYKEN